MPKAAQSQIKAKCVVGTNQKKFGTKEIKFPAHDISDLYFVLQTGRQSITFKYETQEIAVRDRLYSTCQFADGYHWVLKRPEGQITAESNVGFPTKEDALNDLGIHRQNC